MTVSRVRLTPGAFAMSRPVRMRKPKRPEPENFRLMVQLPSGAVRVWEVRICEPESVTR